LRLDLGIGLQHLAIWPIHARHRPILSLRRVKVHGTRIVSAIGQFRAIHAGRLQARLICAVLATTSTDVAALRSEDAAPLAAVFAVTQFMPAGIDEYLRAIAHIRIP